MAISTQSKPALKKWQFSMITGFSIGIAVAIANSVERNFEAKVGYWGAFALALLTAASIGGLVSLVATWLFKPKVAN